MARRKVVATKRNQRKAKVDFVRNELSVLLPAYYTIRDAIDGEIAIKGLIGGVGTGIAGIGNGGLPLMTNAINLMRARYYLPQPNPEDRSAANEARYRAYVTRAVWYGVTGRTLEGMAGQIFLRDPQEDFASELKPLKKNADGAGLTLDQTAYRAVRHCIAYGRTGMLVDYPVQDTPTTVKALADGEIQPIISVYNPWDIINWRVTQVGAKKKLTLVVLREMMDQEGDDGFQITIGERYRELRIDEETGFYVSTVHSSEGVEEYNPKDAKGNPFTEIPFHFVGSENNDIAPNRPPLYDLAALNIGHYRNSADYEESCFIAGQATPVLTGLTEDWVLNVLKSTVALGSRSAIFLPVGGNATLIQAAANSLPHEAMQSKEEQMVSLGAKLVQLQRSSRSATQQIIETTSESSTLANIAFNVSDAMVWALDTAAKFVSRSPKPSKYVLNSDFDLTSMTADDQNAIIKQWQSGAITFPEMRSALKKAGIATEDDKQAKIEIQADIKEGLIPDPAAVAGSMSHVPDAKGASGAGGPQPKRIRRQSKPAGSA